MLGAGHLGEGASIGDDEGDSCSHGFGDHQPERLRPDAGEHHQVHAGEEQIRRHVPQPFHAGAEEIERLVDRGHCLGRHVARVPGQEQTRISRNEGQCPRQHVDTLVRRQSAEVSHGPLVLQRIEPEVGEVGRPVGVRPGSREAGRGVDRRHEGDLGAATCQPRRDALGPGPRRLVEVHDPVGVSRGGERRDESVAPQEPGALRTVPRTQPRDVGAAVGRPDRDDVRAHVRGGVEDLGGGVGSHDRHGMAELQQGLGMAEQHLLAAAQVGVVGGEMDAFSASRLFSLTQCARGGPVRTRRRSPTGVSSSTSPRVMDMAATLMMTA